MHYNKYYCKGPRGLCHNQNSENQLGHYGSIRPCHDQHPEKRFGHYGPRRLCHDQIPEKRLGYYNTRRLFLLATLVQGRYFIAEYQESDLATLT